MRNSYNKDAHHIPPITKQENAVNSDLVFNMTQVPVSSKKSSQSRGIMLARISTQDGMQMVCIPKELQLSEKDYEILQVGNSLLIRPVLAQKLTHLMACFAAFSPDFMADGRDT